jgi:small subunit ribosomal protein S7
MKLFGKYDFSVQVNDPGLVRYISLEPRIVPHAHGRLDKRKFLKSKASIVERFMKHLMGAGHKGKKHFRTSQHTTGKYHKAYNITEKAFSIIEQKTKKNPLQVLIDAIQRGGPREEITTLGLGGRKVPKQVDTSPQRRVDLALRWLVQGAYQKSVNRKTTIEQSLAEEIISASNNDPKSLAVSKKTESERQAAASR